MAMDIFKAIKDAGVMSSVFQRPQPKPKTFIEMAAAAPMAASPLFKFPGQKADYAVPGSSSVPPVNPATALAASSNPAERAYQAEKARVAQLTAQDPELKRYETARAAAKSQEEMNAARDIGMQIWAQRNPKLAAKVKPGQSGYEAIQNQINVGLMGAPADLPFAPDSLLSEGAMQSIPSYVGASDLQPVGTPLPATTFDTPENQ